MKKKKGRGRPKLQATKQRDKEKGTVKKVIREVKTRAPMSEKERQETQTVLNGLTEWERQTLRQFHVPPMKKELAHAAASIGDESLEGHELRVGSDYRKALLAGQAARVSGTNVNQRETVERKTSFLSKHENLIDKLIGRRLSTSQIAETIFRQNANGTGPSVRTIRRWIGECRTKKLAKPLAKKNN